MPKTILLPTLLVTGLVLTSRAFAADQVAPDNAPPPPAALEQGWTFTVAPYGWLAGLSGTVRQFGLDPIEVDASFIDILGHFEIGGMAVAEARYDRFGVAVDFQYVKMSTGVDTPPGIIADNVELTAETLTALGAAEYRVYETDTTSFDLMAGGRLWSVNTDVDPQGGIGDALFFSDGDTWVDPIVGGRARIALSEHAYFTGWAMVGGFGLGSDFTWDVMGAVGYEVSDSIAVIGGYRALGVDYTNGDFTFDVVQQGPIIGARFAF